MTNSATLYSATKKIHYRTKEKVMLEDFGDWLKAYRLKHGLTQREMAERMGISTNHFSVLERKLKLPRAITIEKFQRLLSLDQVEILLHRSDLSNEDKQEYADLLRSLDGMDAKKRKNVIEVLRSLLELM